jgi:hypothetical protein
MALTTTPQNRADLPDVTIQETDTSSTATTDVFDGAKSVYGMKLDNGAETVDNIFFKFYNAKSVDPTTDLPVLKIKILQGTERNITISDGLAFTTGCSFRGTSGTADTDTTSPSDSATATILVGS